MKSRKEGRVRRLALSLFLGAQWSMAGSETVSLCTGAWAADGDVHCRQTSSIGWPFSKKAIADSYQREMLSFR